MAAILRSGKFLRLFSGVARNLAAGTGKNDENGLLPQQGLLFDKNFSQASFSIQNVLPYIGVSDSGHAEDRFPTRLLSTPNRYLGRVSKEEIELMMLEIESTEADTKSGTMNLLSSQALLAIRLCGSTLDQEMPSIRSGMVSKIWSMLQSKGIPTTVVHYNALLRVHLENGHKFVPEQVLEDMRVQGVTPDKETFQCFISRHCQEGNIDGASKVLQMMKAQGIKVNENIFNSLILGHGEAGDMARSHGMLKVMKQWGLVPSQETYLTLACAYAKHGDWQNVEKVMAESQAQGVGFKDGDYLELIFILSEGGHKEHIGKLLALTHPETETFSSMASHLVVRLVNSGHDDVAYNLVQYTVDQSCEEGGREVCGEFLEQIVRVGRPVTKLLWIVNDMAEKKLLTGGLDKMVDIAIKHKNFGLSAKLTDILVSEGGKIEEKNFGNLLKLALKSKSDEDLLSCAKIGQKLGFLTPEVLKKQVFPHIDSWPELVVTSLEEAGVGREVTVTPLVEWLVGQGRTEAAGTVAGIFSEHVDNKLKFLTAASKTVNSVCNHFHEGPKFERSTTPQATPTQQSATTTTQTTPTPDTVNIATLSQTELESLLSNTTTSPTTRGQTYMRLLEMFSATGAIDQAIQLSRRLKSEETLHLPQFYDLFGCLIESQFTPPSQYPYGMQAYTFNPQLNQFIPVNSMPVPVVHNGYGMQAYPPGMMPQPYYMPPQDTFTTPDRSDQDSGVATPHSTMSGLTTPHNEQISSDMMSPPYTASPQPSLSGTATPLYPESCYTESYEFSFEAGVLHRQLKRAISSSKANEGLASYKAMERLGRVVNVTETSALVEQLIRADLMTEAAEITRGMLVRDTHPLPKIFRFLLNKLAVNGSVEEILSIGQFLPTKIKKDVSFDNRLCNAYLSAGRGQEFLEVLVKDLETAIGSNNTEMINIVKDKFPRGGAMGLLDNHPELLDRYTLLATKFASIDYVAPMNVLWTYHFIHGNRDIASSIWQHHVKSSNQIMFQKVCQVARATGNIDLAFGLVRHLAEADQVTSGARGIAYSCLLDCLCASNEHQKGWAALKEALDKKVALEDINRTALVRLKQGLEDEGQMFPYTIPPKNTKKDFERSLSPIDWNEM
eukprot:GFUD01023000.1.p1 GENE.GFUD01023000.1~~GFUD01023000.1.p1  ORF type:complete len:1120 (-),score=366.36 GFUD01023000.1:285-3644(-)